jgi:hypothetical protein
MAINPECNEFDSTFMFNAQFFTRVTGASKD